MSRELESVEPEETARRLIGEADGELYLLGATARQLVAVTTAVRDVSGVVRVLSERAPLRRLRADFTVAARAAEAVDAGRLAFGEYDADRHGGTIAVTETRVYTWLFAEGASACFGGDGSFHAAVREYCRTAWQEASSFALRTPPLARVRSSLRETFEPGVARDFETTLEAATRLRDRTNFDAVAAAVLVGARHDLAQYDLAKWGEDVGLASRATFSRVKNGLSEDGVVETSNGGPRERQRLGLTAEYDQMADDHGLAEVIVRIVT